MRLIWSKTLWGAVGRHAPHATFREAIPAIAAEGWGGVVFAPISWRFEPDTGTLDELGAQCREHGLHLSIMVHTWGSTLDDHLRDLRDVLPAAAAVDPQRIICHAGLDAFDRSDRTRVLVESLIVGRDLGVEVAHETHRHRPLFTPWATAEVLAELPDLLLALDLSHWTVVAERLMGDDERSIVEAAARRTVHIDARVGHEQGPQVPDPAAPEWSGHVDVFDRWWRRTVELATAAGRADLVVCPEYGPPPYQQTLPYTAMPTTDLWALCRRERDRLRGTLVPD